MGWRSGRGVSSRQPPTPPALAPARQGRASVPAIQVADSKDYSFSAGKELSPGRAPAHARSHSRSSSVRWQEAHSGPVFSIMAATDQGDSSYSRLQARTTHRAPQLGGVMVISLACWGLLGTPPPHLRNLRSGVWCWPVGHNTVLSLPSSHLGPSIQRSLPPCMAAGGLGLMSWCPWGLSQAVYAVTGLCLGVGSKVQSGVGVRSKVSSGIGIRVRAGSGAPGAACISGWHSV